MLLSAWHMQIIRPVLLLVSGHLHRTCRCCSLSCDQVIASTRQTSPGRRAVCTSCPTCYWRTAAASPNLLVLDAAHGAGIQSPRPVILPLQHLANCYSIDVKLLLPPVLLIYPCCSHCLFGRNWGCAPGKEFKNLHFELCYYQAIEEAIQRKLPRVEAGAQGEHKLQRGLLPNFTYSAHYLPDPLMQAAVQKFLDRENVQVGDGFAPVMIDNCSTKRRRGLSSVFDYMVLSIMGM